MKCLPVFLSIIGLISLIGLIGIKGTEIVWAAGGSKLGLFLIYSSDGGQKVINACPKMMTFFDPQGDQNRLQRLRDYKSKCPGGISVVRIHNALAEKQVDFKKDPATIADEFSQVIITEINKIGDAKLIDYVSGTNEFENYDDEELVFQEKREKWQWVGRFWTRLAQDIKQVGFKPNIGDLNVGHPVDVDVLQVLLPALREVKKLGGAWSYHGYTIDYSADGTNSSEGENSLRYRKFYEHLAKYAPDLSDLPLLITETGVAEGGNRLQGFMPNNIEKFKQWLTWYDGEIQKDGYVVGATIFQSGETGQWASFNTDYIAEWLCTKLGGTDCKVTVAEYKGSTSTTDKCANKKSKAEEIKPSNSDFFNRNAKQLKTINRGRLPPVNIGTELIVDEEGCIDQPASDVNEGTCQYNIAASIGEPPSETSSLNCAWWQKLWTNFKDIFSFGNKKAEDLLARDLPPDEAPKMLTYQNQKFDNTGNVLGLFGSKDRAMEKALSLLQCAGLPADLCKDVPGGYTGSGPQTSTPPPSSGYPIINPPPGCGQEDSGSEGYTGNTCQLVTSGWCSISCLKQFTEGNIETAARLSQICMLESGGNPVAGPNTGCLKGRTQEYSVGLFQINLIDRCSGGILNEWAERKICTILDENIFNQCVADMENPIQNINKAYSLTNGGWNWNPWKIASERCGFIDTIENNPR